MKSGALNHSALLLMRAGPAHPLHCSTVGSASALLLSRRLPGPLRGSKRKEKVLLVVGARECGRWLESSSRQGGGAGGPKLAEDGSQRIHGARTDPLSLSRTHVSLSRPASLHSVDEASGQTNKKRKSLRLRLHLLLPCCCVQFFIHSWF